MGLKPHRVIVSNAIRGVFAAFGTVVLAHAEDATFEKDYLPLVQQFCMPCHSTENMKGDLDLERFKTTGHVIDSIAIWQRIAKRLENHEMPPRKSPQPTPDERKKLIAWIESLRPNITDCNQLASEETASWYPGYVMSRRLNRAEYQNTLRDLLGIEINVAHLFPADGAGGEGFDNNGSSLFLSAIQIEKYLDAADLAIETALPAKRGLKMVAEKSEALAPNKLITAVPSKKLPAREAARTVLGDFVQRAWRRPVTDEEIDKLLGVFNQAYKRREGYEASLKFAFKAALISPNFLFLAEPEPPQPGNYELGDFPLASRLSYFLWASMPDDELFVLAFQGKLRDTDVLQNQIKRMLRDPKARALGEQFALQWMGITQLGETVKPDAKRFPEFDDALAKTMRAEAANYFNYIIAEDRSLLELIDARYTFVNEKLAAIYGIDGVAGPELRKVEFADENRGGVLGMAAVLTMTSHPLRTSPVLRGKWVLEQLLGDRVPPPPPNVAQLPEDDHQPDGLTFRQRMEAHRKNPDCASCHQRMDPIGFGLENFDPIGRWRTAQAGQPVDASGELPSGDKFNGPKELKGIILAHKEQFAQNISRKMTGYALGRSLTQYDDCVIKNCVEALKDSGYKPSALITQIVLSYPFRHRYSGGHESQES